MPLMKCVEDGKPGFKWGRSGHCYNSPDQKENKRKSVLQGVSYEGSQKVNQMLKHSRAAFLDQEGVDMAKAALKELFPRGYLDTFTNAIADFFSKSEMEPMNQSGVDYAEKKKDKEKKDEADIQIGGGIPQGSGGDSVAEMYDVNHPNPEVKVAQSEDEPGGQHSDESIKKQYGGLDTKTEQKAGNIVVPPYNKEASPDSDPDKDVPNYKVPTRDDMSVADMDEEEEESEASFLEYISVAFISTETRNHLPDDEFAGEHKSFPIRSAEDVRHAAMLLHHAHDPSKVKKNIVRIAKKKGFKLPATWSHETDACYM